MPLQKMANCKKKTQNKLWIAKEILKSASIKNKFFRKVSITKDLKKKKKKQIEKIAVNYKTNITKLIKKAKLNTLTISFQKTS